MKEKKSETSLNFSNEKDIISDKKLSNVFMDPGMKDKTILGRISQSLIPNISEESANSVPFYKLYRYATCLEQVAVFSAVLFGILMGCCVPTATILYGEFTTLLIDRVVQVGQSTPTFMLNWFGGGQILINATEEENRDALLADAVAFALGCSTVSFVQFIFGMLCVDLLNFASLRQINRIRQRFFESVLRQDMSWYDTNTGTNFASTITEDLDKMKNGIGEKVGIFLYLVSSFVVSVVISFIYGWKLTLVVISCAPIIILSTSVVAKVQSNLTEKELKSYSIAGIIAEEVLGSIRTVVAFGGESKEIERYSYKLQPAKKMGAKKGNLFWNRQWYNVVYYVCHLFPRFLVWC